MWKGRLYLKEQLINLVAKEMNVKTNTVKQGISLLDEGNTVPFIARYRKEITGGLDEVAIKEIQDRWNYAVQLSERKGEVIRLIEEQGKLTEELKHEIQAATQLQRVEDLYRPYRQKRRTRATIAKEKGLEPLAKLIWEQEDIHVQSEAEKYFSEEHELQTVEDVLAGVNDIIAEWISDDPEFREYIRDETLKRGLIASEIKNEELDEKNVYKMYYEYSESVHSIVAHRILALNRGEKEDVLRVIIDPPVDRIIEFLEKSIIKSTDTSAEIIKNAIEDS